jgi:serine/threonine protein kinase
MSEHPRESFPRSQRFTFHRRLGAGGFGVVYEAYDSERATRVALKTLHQIDAAALYGFKREFRALADVVHPNLVTLHELVSEDDRWFFTMVLVEGTDFFTFVRPDPALGEASTVTMPVFPSSPGPPSSVVPAASLELAPTMKVAAPRTLPAGAGPEDAAAAVDPARWIRLRSALRQLAEGLVVLHVAGKLHRDLKPSNVLVTREGRVIILDFGLVMDVAAGSAHPSTDRLAGTPAYMAPEQAANGPATPACDWYAVGTMLYEALTCRLPFDGAPLEILMRKLREEPAPPSAAVQGVPADLDTLCVDLLRQRPEDRPNGAEVLRRLAQAGGEAARAPPQSIPSVDRAPFVGREKHLTLLRGALERVKSGRATTVHVRGVSGMGKSALVRHFLDTFAGDETVILEGRCYEREAVPYKAVDNLIDTLSRYLSRLPEHRAAELLPREVHALVQLFPVLERAPAIAAAPRRGALPPDVQELRRRGFVALRELFARIADRKPLVLHIDDLQWGDADSAALLADLLREPDPPALLLLIGYRSEDAGKSEMLRRLPPPAGPASDDGGDHAVRDLVVGALDHEEAVALALHVLGGGAGSSAQAEAIAKEATGNPFFLHELARGVRDRSAADAGEIRLETVLADRLARLPADARGLLEAVAVAGKPLGRRIAQLAATLSPEQERAAMAVLRAERVLRSRGAGEDEELETFHDRIRETAVAQLGPLDLAALHLRIAVALEASGSAEPDALALHFRRAERPDRAAPYAVLAGDRAAKALAFERAAARYAYALEAAPGDAAHERALRIKLGDALRNTGRGAEAAREYSAAAIGASPEESIVLRQRAAEQLLVSGHVDEGRLALRDVLASVGMTFFESPWMVLLSFVFHRFLIRLHRLRAPKVVAGKLPAARLARMEVCWSANIGLSLTNSLRGAEFHARYLLMALRAGDPYHLARALAMEAAHAAVDDAGGRQRALRAHRDAEALANEVGDPYLLASCTGWRSFAEGVTGHWSESFALGRTAEDLWAGRCRGVAWELATTRLMITSALFHRGELRELSARVAPLTADADARGDLFAMTWFRVTMTFFAPLFDDRPDAAREVVQGAMSAWSQREFDYLHFFQLLALVRIDVYAGDPLAARDRFAACWPKITRAFLLRFQFQRVFAHYLRACSALAAAALHAGKDERLVRTLLHEADRDIRRLAREAAPWAAAKTYSLRAGYAALTGDQASAASLLDRAASAFDACEMALFAAAARRRRGQLIGGNEGRALVEAAEAWMVGQGVKNPARVTTLFGHSDTFSGCTGWPGARRSRGKRRRSCEQAPCRSGATTDRGVRGSPIETRSMPTCSLRARSRARRARLGRCAVPPGEAARDAPLPAAPGGSARSLALRCARRRGQGAVDGGRVPPAGSPRIG